MMVVSATTACITAAFCERVVVGVGIGGGNGDNIDNAAGTEDADPPIVAVSFATLTRNQRRGGCANCTPALRTEGGRANLPQC
jgi:hypothetical protein